MQRREMRIIVAAILMMPLVSIANEIELESVSVHLFLEKSGVFSKDITTAKEFLTHNYVPFGEGIPENEIFHSYLVKILFDSSSETFVKGDVAEIKITNNKDNSLVLKDKVSDLYVGPEKKIYKSFFVGGHECEYQTLVVSTKSKTISKTLPFHCGE